MAADLLDVAGAGIAGVEIETPRARLVRSDSIGCDG
jgi:hypothetical protein